MNALSITAIAIVPIGYMIGCSLIQQAQLSTAPDTPKEITHNESKVKSRETGEHFGTSATPFSKASAHRPIASRRGPAFV